MDNIWVVVEIDSNKETERLSSIHMTEEIANEVAEYYRDQIPYEYNNISYEVHSWMITTLEQIQDKGTVIDMSEEENKIIN